MANYKLEDIEAGGSGMDAFFQENPQIVTPLTVKTASAKQRLKVGSLDQLSGFQRVSQDHLINKSTQDLWSIKADGDSFFIERLFHDDGSPLKG